MLALSGGVRGGVLWDLATRRARASSADGLPVAVEAFGFSPDGRSLAVAIADFGARSPYDGTGFAPRGDLQLWDVSFPRSRVPCVPGPFGATADGGGVFSADGRFLATVAVRRRARSTCGTWAHRSPYGPIPGPPACAVAGRGLDRSEWDRYVGSAAYVSTCRSP